MKSFLAATALLTLTLLPPALAEVLQAAIITIEASHGGAGEGLTNMTLEIPLLATYTNHSALDEVSTLYLVGARGVPFKSITCTPFRNANGSGDAGLPFNSTSPSFLSTNTVELGSIVCLSMDISFAPSGVPGSRPLTTSSATKAGNSTSAHTTKHHAPTSTLVKTTSAGGSTQEPSTSTMVVTGAGGSGPSQTGGGATGTASASASLSSGNSASGISLGSEFFGGLALAGFGIAFVL